MSIYLTQEQVDKLSDSELLEKVDEIAGYVACAEDDFGSGISCQAEEKLYDFQELLMTEATIRELVEFDIF